MGMIGHALAQGVAAAAGSGADSMEKQMQEQRRIDAEKRAADQALDLQQRMQAAKEAMQQRIDERFQAILKRKTGEQIPLEIAPGDPAPQDVADMTRMRSREEAIEAALQEASETDGAAYRAGRGMLDAELADSRSDKKDKAAQRREDERNDIAREQIAQRDRESERRAANDKLDYEAAIKRATSGGGKGGGGGKKSAQVQTLEFMRDQLGMSNDELKAYATRSKGKTDAQMFLDLKRMNKFADDEEIMQQVQTLKALNGAGASASAAPSAAVKPRMKWNPNTGKFE